MTNDEMSEIVETSDQWIQERTGIRQRHIAADGELTSDLATQAARAILANAGIAAEEIDLLVLATTTPDKTFPATATAVQANIGMDRRYQALSPSVEIRMTMSFSASSASKKAEGFSSPSSASTMRAFTPSRSSDFFKDLARKSRSMVGDVPTKVKTFGAVRRLR